MIGFAARECTVRPLNKGLLAYRFKQCAIQDWRLLVWEDLVLVFDLSDIEVVAQQVRERSSAERDAATCCTRRKRLEFGSDVSKE